jgi:hypothetical protein
MDEISVWSDPELSPQNSAYIDLACDKNNGYGLKPEGIVYMVIHFDSLSGERHE